jgi:hypothetical protein
MHAPFSQNPTSSNLITVALSTVHDDCRNSDSPSSRTPIPDSRWFFYDDLNAEMRNENASSLQLASN